MKRGTFSCMKNVLLHKKHLPLGSICSLALPSYVLVAKDQIRGWTLDEQPNKSIVVDPEEGSAYLLLLTDMDRTLDKVLVHPLITPKDTSMGRHSVMTKDKLHQ